MTINAILATDSTNGIGKDNGLPWPRSNRDMSWFRSHTEGGVVIMGRKTWESLPKRPLKNRTNIVITTTPLADNPDAVYYGDIGKVLQTIQSDFGQKQYWIIGGANLYAQAIPYCDELYLTKFKNTYDCDTFIDPTVLDPFQRLDYEESYPEVTFTIWRRL